MPKAGLSFASLERCSGVGDFARVVYGLEGNYNYDEVCPWRTPLDGSALTRSVKELGQLYQGLTLEPERLLRTHGMLG